jgi:hypothetical protein
MVQTKGSVRITAVPRFLTLKINPACGTWAENKSDRMKKVNVRFGQEAGIHSKGRDGIRKVKRVWKLLKTGTVIATLFLLLCSSHAGAQAVAIYKNKNGMTVYMTMSNDGIVLKQNNDVIAFQMTCGDANGFCFNNPQYGSFMLVPCANPSILLFQ